MLIKIRNHRTLQIAVSKAAYFVTCVLHHLQKNTKRSAFNQFHVTLHGGKLLNFTLFSTFGTFSPSPRHPPPPPSPAFTCIFSNALHYACRIGYAVQRKLVSAMRVPRKQLGESYSTLRVFSLGFLVLSHPTPLRLHAFVAMHSIMLAMGSVGQKKLASAMRV